MCQTVYNNDIYISCTYIGYINLLSSISNNSANTAHQQQVVENRSSRPLSATANRIPWPPAGTEPHAHLKRSARFRHTGSDRSPSLTAWLISSAFRPQIGSAVAWGSLQALENTSKSISYIKIISPSGCRGLSFVRVWFVFAWFLFYFQPVYHMKKNRRTCADRPRCTHTRPRVTRMPIYYTYKSHIHRPRARLPVCESRRICLTFLYRFGWGWVGVMCILVSFGCDFLYNLCNAPEFVSGRTRHNMC